MQCIEFGCARTAMFRVAALDHDRDQQVVGKICEEHFSDFARDYQAPEDQFWWEPIAASEEKPTKIEWITLDPHCTEYSLWNRALTVVEIQQLYTLGAGVTYDMLGSSITYDTVLASMLIMANK